MNFASCALVVQLLPPHDPTRPPGRCLPTLRSRGVNGVGLLPWFTRMRNGAARPSSELRRQAETAEAVTPVASVYDRRSGDRRSQSAATTAKMKAGLERLARTAKMSVALMPA